MKRGHAHRRRRVRGPRPDAEERRLATAELSLGGMHCSACAARIEGALAHQAGVVSASVNLATTRAFVAYDPAAVGVDELCGAVDGVGYAPPRWTDDGGGAVSERPTTGGCGPLISWPLAVAAFVVAAGRRPRASAVDGWAVLVLAVAVELAGGWPFLRTTVRLAPAGRDEHGHADRAGDAGRAGGERGGGHRPRTAGTTTSAATARSPPGCTG